jgi:CubicO group peptidase (beta-lactamase class C family)
MYTTVDDLDRFWRSFAAGGIVSKTILELMTVGHVRISQDTDYGYGVYLGGRTKEPAWFIVGGDAGVGFDSRWFPAEELATTIMANTTDGEETVREALLAEL